MKLPFKTIVAAFILTVAFTAVATYAWNTIWHGTDWMLAGETITSQEIAENFEYLKSRLDVFASSTPTSTVHTPDTITPEWQGTDWIIVGDLIDTQKVIDNFDHLYNGVEYLEPFF